MKIAGALILSLVLTCPLPARDAGEIMKKIDANRLFTSQKFKCTMIIEKENRKLIKNFHGSGIRAGDKSFMEFTNREDRGVKYLKSGKELWIYFPDADDVMKISGHMLRQGMMGSDISYEDMLETEEMVKKYSYTLLRGEKIDGRACHVLELNALSGDAAYARQVIFADTENYVPLKIEMYAKGGRLIKEIRQYGIKKSGSYYIASRMTIQDMRKKKSITTLIFEDFQFNVNIPDSTFSTKNLKR